MSALTRWWHRVLGRCSCGAESLHDSAAIERDGMRHERWRCYRCDAYGRPLWGPPETG